MKTLHEFHEWLHCMLEECNDVKLERMLKTIIWQLQPIINNNVGDFVNEYPGNDEADIMPPREVKT
mgnify:FL=1